MTKNPGQRTPKFRGTLTKRTVALEPAEENWIACDDKLTGFGVLRVHPAGPKSSIVNYRTRRGGTQAPNNRVVVARYGKVTTDHAPRLAQNILARVAPGCDPAEECAEGRAMPTPADACDEYMTAKPNRSKATNQLYRQLPFTDAT